MRGAGPLACHCEDPEQGEGDEAIPGLRYSKARGRLRNLTCKVCPEPSRRVIPSTFALLSVNCARNLGEIASAESILSEANVPRNDTSCRIATHPSATLRAGPSGARNDSYFKPLVSLSLFWDRWNVLTMIANGALAFRARTTPQALRACRTRAATVKMEEHASSHSVLRSTRLTLLCQPQHRTTRAASAP